LLFRSVISIYNYTLAFPLSYLAHTNREAEITVSASARAAGCENDWPDRADLLD
jgi:hypothetical protein